MRFNKLSDQDKGWLITTWKSDLTQEQRFKLILDKFKIHRRTVHSWLKKLQPEDKCEVLSKARVKKVNKKKKTYFVTWAQNATPAHKPMWDKVLKYSKHHNAEILVIPGRYKNPTSTWSDKQESEEWWDSEVMDYLYANREQFHEKVTIVGDIKIQPTAIKPLSGMQSVTGATTSFFGHPRQHLQSLPVLEGHSKKLMLTTGACTVKNYTDSKAGKKGEFHHTYGFAILEIDGPDYYVRQVSCSDNGSFRDLFWEVVDNAEGEVEVNDVRNILTYTAGDIHEKWLDQEIFARKMAFMDFCKPENLILHDVFDGYSVNPHNIKDPVEAYQRYVTGGASLKKELLSLNKFMSKVVKYNPVVVSSNHDWWLDRWIKSMDWKKDIINALEYLYYAQILLSGKAPKGLIPFIIETSFGNRVKCLDVDESFVKGNCEHGHHGYIGAHGSKGSILQFSKMNVKVTVGDYHKPEKLDGAMGVGTSTVLRMGYNKGPSAHMNADVILHEDGKRQHLIWMENGKFTIHDNKF